jgi:hypothetical protein
MAPMMNAMPTIEPTTAPAMTPPLGPPPSLVTSSVELSVSSGSDGRDGTVADGLVSVSVEDAADAPTVIVINDSLSVVELSVSVSPTTQGL